MRGYAKAAVGFLVAFLTPLGAATLDDSLGGSNIVANEWITALVAGLVTLVAVFAVPNRPTV